MVRTLPPIALVVGVAFAPVCARAQSQLSLKSVSVARFFGARVATETRGSAYVSALDLRLRRQLCAWAVAAHSWFSLNYEIKVPVPMHHDA
jgi:hypothetical protein